MANIKQIKQVYYNHKTKIKNHTKQKFFSTILKNQSEQNNNPTYTFIKNTNLYISSNKNYKNYKLHKLIITTIVLTFLYTWYNQHMILHTKNINT